MMEEQKVEKIFIDKANGKNVDRKDFKAMMVFVRAGEITATATMQEVGLKLNTFYRRVKELGLKLSKSVYIGHKIKLSLLMFLLASILENWFIWIFIFL